MSVQIRTTVLCPPPAGIDLIAAFYGCLYAGCVPITVRPPHPQNIATTLPTVKMIVEVNAHVGHVSIRVVVEGLDVRDRADTRW